LSALMPGTPLKAPMSFARSGIAGSCNGFLTKRVLEIPFGQSHYIRGTPRYPAGTDYGVESGRDEGQWGPRQANPFHCAQFIKRRHYKNNNCKEVGGPIHIQAVRQYTELLVRRAPARCCWYSGFSSRPQASKPCYSDMLLGIPIASTILGIYLSHPAGVKLMP
jgi:hypothetical protein